MGGEVAILLTLCQAMSRNQSEHTMDSGRRIRVGCAGHGGQKLNAPFSVKTLCYVICYVLARCLGQFDRVNFDGIESHSFAVVEACVFCVVCPIVRLLHHMQLMPGEICERCIHFLCLAAVTDYFI